MLWQRRTSALLIMATIAVFLVAAFSLKTVGAYSLQGTPQSSAGTLGTTGGVPVSLPSLNFNSLLAPFQGFINSLGSGGNVATPQLNLSSIPESQLVTSGARNVFQQFDTWLYGIVGFHISGLFVAILSVLGWVLGIAQQVVNWLLGLFR